MTGNPHQLPDASSPTVSVMHRNFFAAVPESWDDFLRTAEVIDEAGIDRVVMSDHVVMGDHLDEYAKPEAGGIAGGRQPTGPDGVWLDPLATLAVIAGRTRRVRLATAILLAALRRPAVLAKHLATLDSLSGGRLDIGVGIGWQREEYEAAGLDYRSRGRLLDHSLDVVTTLWRDTPASFADDRLAFDGIYLVPKPAQAGGVPIWVSGRVNDRVLDRIVRFGAGWIPWGDDAADPGPGVRRIREALASVGRDPSTLGVVGALRVERDDDSRVDVARTMAPVESMAANGITDFRLQMSIPSSHERALDELSMLADAFRARVGGKPTGR